MRKNKPTPFGLTIKKSLLEKNMTQTDLALAVGSNVKYISHIIYGIKSGDKYIDKICTVLEISHT